jgi:hypothetical protein
LIKALETVLDKAWRLWCVLPLQLARCKDDELLDHRGGTMMAVVVILSNAAHSYEVRLFPGLQEVTPRFEDDYRKSGAPQNRSSG